MSLRKKLLVAAVAALGLAVSSSEASISAATDYPTTCQWNGCPTPGNAICFVAWNGYYICTRPEN